MFEVCLALCIKTSCGTFHHLDCNGHNRHPCKVLLSLLRDIFVCQQPSVNSAELPLTQLLS